MKFYRKIKFLFYFYFWKFVSKNRAFGNNTIFLKQFFLFRGDFHISPWLRPWFHAFPLAMPVLERGKQIEERWKYCTQEISTFSTSFFRHRRRSKFELVRFYKICNFHKIEELCTFTQIKLNCFNLIKSINLTYYLHTEKKYEKLLS